MWKVACSLLVLSAVAGAVAAPNYTIIAISHLDNKVSEVDPVSGQTLHQFVVPGEWFGEVHEGAISPDSKTFYASVPYAKQVVILDLATFKEKGKIESEYFSRSLETRNFARIGKKETTSGDPHGLALNTDGSKLYITVEYAEVPGVVVYDTKAGKVIKKIETVAQGNYLQVQPRTDKLYYPTEDNRVVVIDTRTDKIVKIIPVQGAPDGVDFAPNGEVWVNGNRDGSVSVIDSTKDTVIKVIQTPGKGSGRTAVSMDGRFAAATHSQSGDVTVIDARTKEIVATLKTALGGQGFPLFSPDGDTLYVLNEGAGDLSVYDMKTMQATGKRYPVGGASFGGSLRYLDGKGLPEWRRPR
jgi:DNA-binding beta-propeller fold protein YncE